jgi:hypothetical protein
LLRIRLAQRITRLTFLGAVEGAIALPPTRRAFLNGLHLLAERLSPPLDALAHEAEAGVGPAMIESRKVAPIARARPETSCLGLLK